MALPEDEDRFQRVLRKYNKHRCPNCKHKLSLGDVAWNWAYTDSGTDYNTVQIECQACQTEIAFFRDWYPTTDYPEKFYGIIEEYFEKKKQEVEQNERALKYRESLKQNDN